MQPAVLMVGHGFFTKSSSIAASTRNMHAQECLTHARGGLVSRSVVDVMHSENGTQDHWPHAKAFGNKLIKQREKLTGSNHKMSAA
jgi:hypothetical protein